MWVLGGNSLIIFEGVLGDGVVMVVLVMFIVWLVIGLFVFWLF